MPHELKLAIFRIVQAALSNVAQHSKASAVRVLLSLFEDELRLGIEDNGVGFDMESSRHQRHGPGGCGLGMMWADQRRPLDDRSDPSPRHPRAGLLARVPDPPNGGRCAGPRLGRASGAALTFRWAVLAG